MKRTPYSIFTIALIALVSLAACCTTEEVVQGNVEPPKHLEFKEINKGILTGNGDEGLGNQIGLSVQSTDDWNVLREKMNSVNESQLEISVDFSETTILAYFDKVRPSGGYTVEISKVVETDFQISVYYELTAPSGNAIDIMTQPFHIVSIPKTIKTINFLPVTE